MKKVIITLTVIALSLIPVHAAKWTASARVTPVGDRIVKKNSLPASIKFSIVNGIPNNKYSLTTNIIQINSADLNSADNDNEIAYVIAYELGSIINSGLNHKISSNSTQKQNKCCFWFNRNKYKNIPTIENNKEKNSDIMGIDLMINAGYNPIAGLVMLTKLPKNTRDNTTDEFANADRATYIYDYLAYNYPTKLKIGYNSKRYYEFLNYLEPQLNERLINREKQEKFNRTQAMLREERIKQLAKYKNSNSLAIWNITYELLQSLTEPETNY